MKVKMLDLTREYSMYREEYISALNKIFDAGSFILGSPVDEFEKNLAKYLNVKHAIGVANGTDALLISLLAAGIKEGDEVITTPFTFFSTGEAIVQAKAKPVFVDIEEETFNIDADKIEAAITKKTKAILPVHLYGNPADMRRINEIAEKYKLIVIEDCAQSVGAAFEEKMTGTFGKAGTISFFPTKNLGTAGDGGAIITNDDEINRISRSLRIHGAVKKYIHASIGFNSRLDSIHAALLDIKLKRLDEKNNRRISLASNYNEKLTNKVKKPKPVQGGRHIYHQYTIIVNDRENLIKHLSKNLIETTVYYPLCLHKQEALLPYTEKTTLPVAEEISLKVISLPIYPELREEEQAFVIDTVNSFYD